MAYNFASSGYKAKFGNLPACDGRKLRLCTATYIKDFDKKSWYQDPIRTIVCGFRIADVADKATDTIDAFGNVNGKQQLSPPHVVDQVIGHVHNFKPLVIDLRTKIRAMDLRLMTELAPTLIGNQAMDYWKQDGITEMEESIQANRVEQRLNDELFAAEERGEVVIRRNPCFVGCVSNFTNFLDLSRKCLRHIEIGVPVVVMSRTNVQQHMYRWVQILVELLKEYNVDTGMVTFLSADLPEQQRVFGACQESPMHLTSSREIAKIVKKFVPKLMASTGGPNTLVASELNPGVGEAVRMSNLIENKGQCTALRHFVCPGVTKDKMDQIYSQARVVKDSLVSIEQGEFAGMFEKQNCTKEPCPAGYEALAGNASMVNCKISKELPVDIQEKWRQLFIDVTSPDASKLSDVGWLSDLSHWLNTEQPISLAVNSPNYDLATKLFESTGMVVYTVGDLEKPALTAQARPQDGECFGEFPPRHQLEETTHFPMIIPSPVAAYNSVYNEDYIMKKAKDQGGAVLGNQLCDEVVLLLSAIQNERLKGYATILLEYLVDAVGPQPCYNGRTALFGLQRPPHNGSVSFVRCESVASIDRLLLFLLPYIATNARSDCSVSLGFSDVVAFDDGVDDGSGARVKPVILLLRSILGPKCLTVGETHAAFLACKEKARVYNSRTVDDKLECCLAGQFMSRLFPMGHIKSTRPQDVKFVEHFKGSRKWLSITPPKNQSNF